MIYGLIIPVCIAYGRDSGQFTHVRNVDHSSGSIILFVVIMGTLN